MRCLVQGHSSFLEEPGPQDSTSWHNISSLPLRKPHAHWTPHLSHWQLFSVPTKSSKSTLKTQATTSHQLPGIWSTVHWTPYSSTLKTQECKLLGPYSKAPKLKQVSFLTAMNKRKRMSWKEDPVAYSRRWDRTTIAEEQKYESSSKWAAQEKLITLFE